MTTSVRELIVELAQVEQAVRVAAFQGASAQEIELAEREQAIVTELRSRDVMVSLGRGAEAAVAATGTEPDDEPGARPAPEASDQQTIADLKQAVASRTTIGRATGILIERYQVDAAEAFERLRVMSQQRNLKVRDVAADLIANGVEEGAGVDRKLSERAVVARAQGILMERHHLTEATALEWLVATARRTRQPLAKVAEHLVLTGTDPGGDPADPVQRSAPPGHGARPGVVGAGT